MASTDTEQLVVSLEARITAFEKNFAKASQTANIHWTAIESRGNQASKRIQADMDIATAGIARGFTALGSSISGSLGLTGVLSAAGFLAMAVKINSELAKMGELAKSAELSTDRIQEVKYAANISGVSDEDFKASLQSSLGLLDEAQRQVNSLSKLFNANGKSIRDSNGDLIKFDVLLERAADLMVHAPSEQDKVKITEMLGLSRDWIRVLEGGPDAFRKVQVEAQKAGVIVDAATIEKAKEFDHEWTKAIAQFKAGMVSALADLNTAFAEFWRDILADLPGGEWLKHALRAWGRDLQGMTMPELEAALRDSVENGLGDVDKIAAEIDRRLGKKPFEITINAKPAEGPKTIVPADYQKNAFERAVFESNKRIAATDAETKTIGLNSEARERAKLVAELEESAKKANTQAGYQSAIVTDQQREKINKLADAMEAAGKRQRVAQEQFKSFNEALQMSGNIAVDFVDKLGDKTAKWNDMLQSVIGSLKKAAIQAALLGTGPLAGMFGTASTVTGGTGGIFGALGKMFGGARAEGGDVSPDKAFLVGERGPEIMVPKGAGTIIPNHKLGGTSTTSHVTHTHNNNVTVNATGGNVAANQDLAERVGRAVQDSARQMVMQEIRTQTRPGGVLAR